MIPEHVFATDNSASVTISPTAAGEYIHIKVNYKKIDDFIFV
jgi:hypothetical protein